VESPFKRLLREYDEAVERAEFLHGLLEQYDKRRRPTSLKFSIPLQVNKATGATMPGAVTFTDDHDEKIPLLWTDDAGTVHPDTTGTVVTSDNVAVISKGDVASDGTYVILRSAGDGTCNITITNGALTDTIAVTVGVPTPTTLAIDAAHATQVPKGTPVT
jgi:hypothetical protein